MRLIFIILLMSCASTSKVDTQLYGQSVESVKQDIDVAIDCNTQIDSEKCKKTIIRVKEILERGVELTKEKDSEIEIITVENKSLEGKAKKWDNLIKFITTVIVVCLLILLGLFLWKYRITILRLAGVPVPPFMS